DDEPEATRSNAELEPRTALVVVDELVLHRLGDAVAHAPREDGEHRRLVDARVDLHHRLAEQLTARPPPLPGDDLVHVEVPPLRRKNLHAVQELVEQLRDDGRVQPPLVTIPHGSPPKPRSFRRNTRSVESTQLVRVAA